MGEFKPPLRSDVGRNEGNKWYECHLCGPVRTKVLVHFDSGSVAPTVGETITGATSTDTFIVEGYTLTAGTFAGGDAVGIIEGNTPTGYDSINLEVFQNDEALNGSSGLLNMATVNGIGAVQISGRLISDKDYVEYNGIVYCKAHFLYEYSKDWQDEAKIDTSTEGDRE